MFSADHLRINIVILLHFERNAQKKQNGVKIAQCSYNFLCSSWQSSVRKKEIQNKLLIQRFCSLARTRRGSTIYFV